MSDSMKQAINTLRLNQRELNDLLEKLDASAGNHENPDREHVRTSFRIESVDLVVKHSSGNRITLPVATRNISRGGISVLHSSFMHTGTPCEIVLKAPNAEPQTVTGIIRRCQHVTGRVHEIGIQFDSQVSTKDLLGLDPLNEAYSLERVDPTRLHGSVLVVTSSEIDRDLIQMYLEETNLAIDSADSVENAVKRAEKGTDIILADFHIGDSDASELISSLNEAQIDQPVVVLVSDKSDTTLWALRNANAAGILTKPTTKEKILQALAEFLHADGDGGPLYSTLTPEDAAFPLLGKFLGDVSRMTLNLEKAVKEDDLQTCLKIVRVFSGTAAPLGFPDVSKIAGEAEVNLTQSGVKAASGNIRSLIVSCRRIKQRPAA